MNEVFSRERTHEAGPTYAPLESVMALLFKTKVGRDLYLRYNMTIIMTFIMRNVLRWDAPSVTKQVAISAPKNMSFSQR